MKKCRVTKYQKMTFSKKIMTVILVVSLIDLQLPFVLAWFGKDIESLTTLALALITEVISCWLIYALKSFFENREEEKTKLERDKLNLNEEGEKEI